MDTLTPITARRAPIEFHPLADFDGPDPVADPVADPFVEPAAAARSVRSDPPPRQTRPTQPTATTNPGHKRGQTRSQTSNHSHTRRSKVRVPELVIGVLLVSGCALAALLLQRSDTNRVTVVVAARHIARGSAISAVDLTGSTLSGDTSMLISGDDAKGLLGQVASVDIAAGVPLSSALFTTASALGPDEALTSVALEPGRMPPDLTPNDEVRIVVVNAGAANAPARLLDATAQVWSIVDADGTNLNTIVTLRGPLSLATDLAAASTVQIARVEGG